MESTVAAVRFVKCPKCLKILTEFPDVPVYKCGGCGAILRAKAHLSDLRISSTDSAIPASKNLPDVDPFDGSDSSHENISMEKSLEYEPSRIHNVPGSEDSEELERFVEVNPEANYHLKSSDKLNESSETMEHYTTSEEDIANKEFANGNRFRRNTRSSSHAYDGSASSTDEDMNDHIPRKYLLSRRTHRNKYVSDSLDSREAVENSIPDTEAIEQDYTFASQAPFRSSSSLRDAQVKINQRSSEQEDQEKILNKVDELRNELRGLFSETGDDKAFIEKVPPKEFRSSLIPFSRHNHSNVCSHLSEAPAPPFHMKSRAINQGPHDIKHKASKSQPMVRLCRPVSGGAPFVICYKCFKLLQLPADFLVSSKKVHKLRCGACLQVLMFSFRPRSRSMPQTPEELQHPPSEENGNLMPLFEEITGWDPTSSSEDSYFSLANSISSEVEPAWNKSGSSDEIVEEGGMAKEAKMAPGCTIFWDILQLGSCCLILTTLMIHIEAQIRILRAFISLLGEEDGRGTEWKKMN